MDIKTISWKRKNGNIIGCEISGIEFNLIAIMNNEKLHALYHKQLKEDHDGISQRTDR